MNNNAKEILTGLAKGSLSLIPCAGGYLNEIFFDIRGRIVQDRINNFVNSFIEHLKKLGITIDEEVLTSENFNDMYISIIRYVIETKSQFKLNIFKSILESSLTVSYESDFKETFLELVNKLDYMEFEILNMFKDTGRAGSMDIQQGYGGCISSLTTKSCKNEIIKRIKKSNPLISTLDAENKYEFYICDLISKSLLVDIKSVGNTYGDLQRKGLTDLYITAFGKEFLRFIRMYDN